MGSRHTFSFHNGQSNERAQPHDIIVNNILIIITSFRIVHAAFIQHSPAVVGAPSTRLCGAPVPGLDILTVRFAKYRFDTHTNRETTPWPLVLGVPW